MPVSKAEALKFSKSNSQRKACYAPASMHEDCDKRIVQAHTLSKSSNLKAIADSSNHVMGVVMNLPSLIKNNGRWVPEKIGINQASTFTGFCAVHDRILFSCLENEKFTGTDEQCFALMFRSLSKEIYAKEGEDGLPILLKMPIKESYRPNKSIFRNLSACIKAV